MIVLHTDLDNTIIYSYKHDIGPHKRNVELYQGRKISFVTEKTYKLLKLVKENMLIVPTTTRTMEQYQRINLGIGTFQYALVCNGGILLRDGKRDEEWYQESLKIIKGSRDVLNKAMVLLEKESRRTFELRFIENLFIFTKCDEPERVVSDLRQTLDPYKVDVFNNGIKVYVIPKNLSKGIAIKRFKKFLKNSFTVAAGDSEFDVSMLKEADIGLAPYGFASHYSIDFAVEEADKGNLFSEAFLEKCLNIKETELLA